MGNVIEILELLDKDTYNRTELTENYKMLAARWGEWEIAGGIGFTVRYIDVGKALFSGLMVTYGILVVISLCSALIFGKVVFPLLSKMYKNNNEELVDMATLKSASQIDQISKSKGWF